MPSKETDIEKKLRIQMGTYQRLIKEVAAYEKEETMEEQTLETMKANHDDPFMIKQQEQVVKETKMMIPDTKTRLQTAFDNLKNLVDMLEAKGGMEENVKFTEAKNLINSV
ncbi:hypothetical protein WA158_004611 [Blastocystis sp. Blastoise]